ncbi:MAG: hypothetical protein V1661_02385 [bacterium]
MFKKQNITIIILAIIFFSACSWFNIITLKIYNSPDETANYFFIQRFAKNGDFFSPEPLNGFLDNNLHPRSISYNGFSLVPQGFIGLPLFYGFFARIFGFFFLKFFTPLLAVLGALAFYGIIKKIFNEKIAFYSMFLLLLFPVFWYYSARYLYPNVPSISLFLIAVWALFSGALAKIPSSPPPYKGGGMWGMLFIFAPALAIALAIRPIEAVWMLPIIIAIAMARKKSIDPIKIFYALAIMLFLAIPVLKNNLVLYGSAFGSGYNLTGPVFDGAAGANSAAASKNAFLVPRSIGEVGLPFGFNFLQILKNVYKILLGYFWWYTAPAILGFIFLFFGKIKKEERFYIFSAVAISAWLIFFYGSGALVDNPNMRLTLGDSHFRYWLPIFVLMIPFAAIFWARLAEKLKQEKILLTAVLVFTATLSLFTVYFSVDDGLASIAKVLRGNYEIKSDVLTIVPEKGIIITGRQDKIFFPDRRVLYAEKLLDNKLIAEVSALTGVEFYYYGLGLNSKDMAEADNFLKIHGFKLERMQIFGKEVLYKITNDQFPMTN